MTDYDCHGEHNLLEYAGIKNMEKRELRGFEKMGVVAFFCFLLPIATSADREHESVKRIPYINFC